MEDDESVTEPPLVRYCATSSTEGSHKTVITDIHWLPDHFEVSLNTYFSTFYCFPTYFRNHSVSSR